MKHPKEPPIIEDKKQSQLKPFPLIQPKAPPRAPLHNQFLNCADAEAANTASIPKKEPINNNTQKYATLLPPSNQSNSKNFAIFSFITEQG